MSIIYMFGGADSEGEQYLEDEEFPQYNGRSVLPAEPITTNRYGSGEEDTVGPELDQGHMTLPPAKRSRKKWSRSATLMLICTYDDKQACFQNTCLRNEEVWNDVSKLMRDAGFEFSGVQCSNKMKMLKQLCGNKLHNMSTKQSGAAAVHFEFFEQMDQIFGRNPTYRPISTANSATGFHATIASNNTAAETSESHSDGDESVQEPNPKKKKTFRNQMLEMVNELKTQSEEREKRKDEREEVKHNLRLQFLQQQQKSAGEINALLTQILDKL